MAPSGRPASLTAPLPVPPPPPFTPLAAAPSTLAPLAAAPPTLAPLAATVVASAAGNAVPAPANAFALTGVPRGLANLAGSCYINAALQTIATSPRLRAVVLQGLGDSHPLPRFFDAYDHADDATLAQRHAEVTGHIRTLRSQDFAPGCPCTSSEVLLALRVQSTEIIGELNALYREMTQGGREFQVGSDANVKNMQYDALRAAGDLKSFLYFTGGHYMAFLRSGAQWYRINDHLVHPLGEAEMQALPTQVNIDSRGYPIAGELAGIVFASYADPPAQ